MQGQQSQTWRSLTRPSLTLLAVLLLALGYAHAMGAAATPQAAAFPVTDYPQNDGPLWQVLISRATTQPFNIVATLLFFMAIAHTFLSPVFLRKAHQCEEAYRQALATARAQTSPTDENPASESEKFSGLRFRGEIFHLLGEVEAIFGIWVLPLMVSLTLFEGWPIARDYIGHGLNFTEPIFVVVIMTIAASRPVLLLAERLMFMAASLGRGSAAAWWYSILTIGPLLGSFITEPAAMTISAMLLSRKFYAYRPSRRLAYATLGLLFVNVSVGGTLTHFAAPPVLMVAGKWGWGLSHMLLNFGWKAAAGILVANAIYFAWFWREFRALAAVSLTPEQTRHERQHVPLWITMVHLFFLAWTVFNNHYPALFVGGFLFYIAFTRATEAFQNELALRPALLVGFFLAGLVVHGGLQGWWIGPVLSGMNEMTLFVGATVLTAFNDNAAITYLGSLVPGFTPAMQHALVAGAVVGGGLTVIANAPNPAGQSILSKFFPDGVSAVSLLLGALTPTAVMAAFFIVFA